MTSASASALAGTSAGRTALRELLPHVLDGLAAGAARRPGPLPDGGPSGVARELAPAREVLPETGLGAAAALDRLVPAFAAASVEPADPHCAGHLHCPPLAVAVAADVAASALNPSLDSWDQGGAGAEVETQVVAALVGLVGYRPDRARGAVTTGGTESNLMGLLFAREQAARRRDVDLSVEGLGALYARGWRPVVFCSALAHFSVSRAAGLLGIGDAAVVPVATDGKGRLDAVALRSAVTDALDAGSDPLAVVATAGTTDLGSIDPLPAIADLVAGLPPQDRPWLHVDAAYGGGALFSDTLRPLFPGLARADSIALDLHKYGWQPVAAGAFLTADGLGWRFLDLDVAYLNPTDDRVAGLPSLLGRSLRTTRRPDAWKIAVTMSALGRQGIGALVDRCCELARHAAAGIAAHPRLELRQDPTLSTVVFRYLPENGSADDVNAALRRLLLEEGRAVVGRADLPAVHLKLTLLNPETTPADLDALLELIVDAGRRTERLAGTAS